MSILYLAETSPKWFKGYCYHIASLRGSQVEFPIGEFGGKIERNYWRQQSLHFGCLVVEKEEKVLVRVVPSATER
jgi:hypothetical protein